MHNCVIEHMCTDLGASFLPCHSTGSDLGYRICIIQCRPSYCDKQTQTCNVLNGKSLFLDYVPRRLLEFTHESPPRGHPDTRNLPSITHPPPSLSLNATYIPQGPNTETAYNALLKALAHITSFQICWWEQVTAKYKAGWENVVCNWATFFISMFTVEEERGQLSISDIIKKEFWEGYLASFVQKIFPPQSVPTNIKGPLT